MTKQQAEQLIAFKEKFSKADPLYTISNEFLLTPYNYGEEIDNFIQFCYDNNLINANYYSIEKELIANRMDAEWYLQLSEEDVIQCLGYLIRGDRFSNGMVASAINDKTIPRLLNRIKVLHAL